MSSSQREEPLGKRVASIRPTKLLLALVAACVFASPAAASPARQVTLLVHGLRIDLEEPVAVWGKATTDRAGSPRWDGLIGHLQQAGHRFGGVIRPRGPKIVLPDCLDRSHTSGNPQEAALFSMEFSGGANLDGLALKGLELAQCLAELRRFTGCQKIHLVTHSAGGLIARAYLQSALPGVVYAGDVDRLITIAAPHQGSMLAHHFGHLLGTRAASLGPDTPLVRQLNDELSLPADVLFASIVVRGVAIGISGLEWPADSYMPHVNRPLLSALPVDFRLGSDQVVHVVSQNLRLARCAARYEAETGRPVLDLLARVPDPSPQDRSPLEATVHEVAPGHRLVAMYVQLLLQEHAPFVREMDEPQAAAWRKLAASQCAFGLVEAQAGAKHRFSVVQDVQLDSLELVDHRASQARYRYAGTAKWPARMFGLGAKATTVQGEMRLSFDPFSRLTAAAQFTE